MLIVLGNTYNSHVNIIIIYEGRSDFLIMGIYADKMKFKIFKSFSYATSTATASNTNDASAANKTWTFKSFSINA